MATVETWFEDGAVEIREATGAEGYLRLDVRTGEYQGWFQLCLRGKGGGSLSLMPDGSNDAHCTFTHKPSVMEMCEQMAKDFGLVCLRLNGRVLFDAAQMALDDEDLEF